MNIPLAAAVAHVVTVAYAAHDLGLATAEIAGRRLGERACGCALGRSFGG
jgi:hypothetical protein